MTGDTACLSVVNGHRTLLANLWHGVQIRWLSNNTTHTRELDVEEIDIMGRSVNHCPKCHGVCDLTMKPDVFIGRKHPSELRSNDADDIA